VPPLAAGGALTEVPAEQTKHWSLIMSRWQSITKVNNPIKRANDEHQLVHEKQTVLTRIRRQGWLEAGHL
jgi:hypothetical protein